MVSFFVGIVVGVAFTIGGMAILAIMAHGIIPETSEEALIKEARMYKEAFNDLSGKIRELQIKYPEDDREQG